MLQLWYTGVYIHKCILVSTEVAEHSHMYLVSKHEIGAAKVHGPHSYATPSICVMLHHAPLIFHMGSRILLTRQVHTLETQRQKEMMGWEVQPNSWQMTRDDCACVQCLQCKIVAMCVLTCLCTLKELDSTDYSSTRNDSYCSHCSYASDSCVPLWATRWLNRKEVQGQF